jgi:perosamine synthetase
MIKIKVSRPFVGEEEVSAVGEILESGNYISGRKVAEFEQCFADYCGTKYAVAVNSCTAALHVSLAVLGIQPGDEVIVPPITFFSTVSAVLHQYGVPIFADIDAHSYCLDARDVERKITARTKAIIPVHLYGNAVEMDALMTVAQNHGLKVVEDCAQANGTLYNKQKVGTFGDIGTFSFFATKHMTTGEGGMLVTDNETWATEARMVRSHGMTDRDHHHYLGYNYRMTEMAAAMGLQQLKKLDHLNDRRIDNSLYLIRQLGQKNLPWLKLPHLQDHIKHSFFWCPVGIDEDQLGMTTKQLVTQLKNQGIETRNRYWEPLYRQKILLEKDNYPHRINFLDSAVDYNDIHLKNAAVTAGRIIGLPNHPGLKKEHLDRIVNVFSCMQ